MSLYQEIILDHYKNPKNFGHLSHASKTGRSKNPMCGDDIEMEIEEGDGKIQDIRFSGVGCAISTAAASLLTEHVKGKSIQEAREMQPSELLDLLHVELTPVRMKCALLPLEVLKKTLSKTV